MSSTNSNFVHLHQSGGYESDANSRPSLFGAGKLPGDPSKPKFTGFVPGGKHNPAQSFAAKQKSYLNKTQGAAWRHMDAYSRHRKLVSDYIKYYGKPEDLLPPPVQGMTDQDVLKQEYRFIRTGEDNDDSTYEKRLAKKYYDQLFKEYCICDMTFYKQGKVGMRWRVEKEVFAGKGQFVCGNKRCKAKERLKSYEVNFKYKEVGLVKQALVKLRLCHNCAYKLNYRKIKELEAKQKEKRKKKKAKRKAKKKAKKSRKGKGSSGESCSDDESLSEGGEDAEVGGRTRKRNRADDSSEDGRSSVSSSTPQTGNKRIRARDDDQAFAGLLL